MPLLIDQPLQLRAFLRKVAIEAGRLALGHFREGDRTTARTWAKAGGSPVTEADIAVDSFLKERLSEALPEAGWLSEETADDPIRCEKRILWVVDPIDGTRAFAAGDPRWAVAIALLVEGSPIGGIVHAPALAISYEATRRHGAFRNDSLMRLADPPPLDAARVAGPKPVVEVIARQAPGLRLQPKVPSLALRLTFVADGSIDLGLASVNAHDWDIAAADLILTEAGAVLSEVDGKPPVYNKLQPTHGVLIAAAPSLHAEALAAMAGRRHAGSTTAPGGGAPQGGRQ
jgi:myo-inositol-1(or 4)-monophosphatase